MVGAFVDGLVSVARLLNASSEARYGQCAEVVLFAGAAGHRKTRQFGRGERRGLSGTHLGDQQGVLRGIGNMREEVHHLLGRLQVQLGRVVVHRLHLTDASPRADALEHQLCVRRLTLEVVAVIGTDQRECEVLRELAKHLVERPVLGEAMVLELDKEPAWLKTIAEVRDRLAANVRSLVENLLRNVAAHAGAESDDPLAVLLEYFEIDAGLIVRGHPVDPAGAHDPDEVLVAFLRAREEQ